MARPPQLRPRRRITRKKHINVLGLHVFAPDCLEQVQLIAGAGLTDDEMAQVFGVTPGKLRVWRRMYKDFDAAIAKGRLIPDAKVLESIYRRAVGYEVPCRTVTKEYDPVTEETLSIKVTESVEHVPGHVGAQQAWAKNRLGWKDKTEVAVNVTHTLGDRLLRAMERVGRASLPSPVESPTEPVELPGEFVVVPGPTDPESAE